MKKILLLFITVLFLFFPPQVFADEGWVIDNLHSDINVLQSGKVAVTETIDVDFGGLQKHGIYRDIPVIYDAGNSVQKATQIAISGVQQDSKPATYVTTDNGNALRIRIGDANRTISGKHRYVIIYYAVGVLTAYDTYDELYWNVTGNAWPVRIAKTSATVTLPSDGVLQVTCFEGTFGSKQNCLINQVSKRLVEFQTAQLLQENEGLSVVVGYTKGIIPILQVTPTPSSSLPNYSPTAILAFIIAAFISMIAGIIGVIWLWLQKGRDKWFGIRNAQIIQGKESTTPLLANEMVVVEYESPEKLRPGEVGVIMDQRADTLDVTATIIDLAPRGYLTITEEPKKWLFGSTDYLLKKTNKRPDGLLKYENLLYTKLFEGDTEVRISDLKTTFYTSLAEVKTALYLDLTDKGYFVGNPEKVKGKYIALGFSLVFCGIFFPIFGGVTFAFYNVFAAIVIGILAGLVLPGLLLALVSNFMSRRTAKGHALAQRIKGYQLFITQAEKYRQKFFENKNLFNEALPYAIVFGVTEKFAQAFKEMGIVPQQPSWYYSSSAFNAYMFSSHINNFSNSFSSAIASAPKSSGFSSGGGFSGGGFGGGGGGSW